MPLPSFDVKNLLRGSGDKKKDNETTSVASPQKTSYPFNFEDGTCYQYPTMAEEAHEMLQVSMLVYSMTDLRSLAKHPKKSKTIHQPERILNLPLNLTTCLELLEENYEVIKNEFGDDEHTNTLTSLQNIHQRYQQQQQQQHDSNSNDANQNAVASFVSQWLSPLRASGQEESIEVEAMASLESKSGTPSLAPLLTAYGDENPDTDMVYAIGMDHIRKRVTVVFRGSVTPTDFIKDASINMNHQPNPVRQQKQQQPQQQQYDTIGIHQGFFDYLLKKRKTQSKFEEIVEHITGLFQEDPERQYTYKLYVTGHSLGGALATLFSLYMAAAIGENPSDSAIPAPVTCISVASPRVGDRNFQAVFASLEEHGLLRHLRIANDRDPVTVMPGATGKKIWATLSPVSYIAFKLMDNEFEEKEKFRHTGIKMLLAKDEYEFFYAGNPLNVAEKQDQQKVSGVDDDKNDDDDNKSSLANSAVKRLYRSTKTTTSTRKEKIPDVVFHLGNAYTENLASVTSDLSKLSLNDLYRIHVAAMVAKKGMVEEGEQS